MAETQEPMLIFMSGSCSGAGKSTCSMGLLAYLMEHKQFQPQDLAYIKPCTQCEDVQLVSKFCEWKGIAHRGIGPIRFYQGFTYEVLEGKHDIAQLHHKIKHAVAEIGRGKRVVVVDGVGYPSVGSVAKISNAEVSVLLGCPILYLAPAGVGHAIDTINLHLTYFNTNSATVLGVGMNNVPQDDPNFVHSFEACQQYVGQYLSQYHPQTHFYGAVPTHAALRQFAQDEKAKEKGVTCRLRESKKSLEMSETEQDLCNQAVLHQMSHFNYDSLFNDLVAFYAS
eukprot:TRINITY_DN13032_c0_g1_i2.p1 TRINITY_DN13032_c0_g1~~TRINITY_DN13032_c0_g1_i2.p1  ORF type:complete len:282 (+),score=53.83 TRINITY_DN13032_c0_g1_i2:66-911(+)